MGTGGVSIPGRNEMPGANPMGSPDVRSDTMFTRLYKGLADKVRSSPVVQTALITLGATGIVAGGAIVAPHIGKISAKAGALVGIEEGPKSEYEAYADPIRSLYERLQEKSAPRTHYNTLLLYDAFFSSLNMRGETGGFRVRFLKENKDIDPDKMRENQLAELKMAADEFKGTGAHNFVPMARSLALKDPGNSDAEKYAKHHVDDERSLAIFKGSIRVGVEKAASQKYWGEKELSLWEILQNVEKAKGMGLHLDLGEIATDEELQNAFGMTAAQITNSTDRERQRILTEKYPSAPQPQFPGIVSKAQ